MRTITNFFCFLILFLLASCSQNQEMLTVINPDGSCYRQFSAPVDSAFMTGNTDEKHNSFPVTLTPDWEISWQFGKEETIHRTFPISGSFYDSLRANSGYNERFTVYIRKQYPSVRKLSEEFALKPEHEWSDMPIKYDFKKEFRWFYTYYSYAETYPKIESAFETPIENYLTPNELSFWLTGTPDLLQGMNGLEISSYVGDLDEKYNTWFYKNYWDAACNLLLKNYDHLKISIPKESIETEKDLIFAEHTESVLSGTLDACVILNAHFNTEEFSQPQVKEMLDAFDENYLSERIAAKYFDVEILYKLLMPGKILKAENAVICNDTIAWHLTAYRLACDDYTLQATSRKANAWAWMLTGLVILIAIGSFIFARKR